MKRHINNLITRKSSRKTRRNNTRKNRWEEIIKPGAKTNKIGIKRQNNMGMCFHFILRYGVLGYLRLNTANACDLPSAVVGS